MSLPFELSLPFSLSLPFELSWPSLLLIGFGIAVLCLLVALIRRRAGRLPYVRRDALFTPAERKFLAVLDRALDDGYRLFGKVRVADVLDVKPMRDRKTWWRAFTRISSKHFDYVICDRDGTGVLCAIELDDASHQRRDRQARDEFLEAACASADLPLLRFEVKRSYAVTEVRSQLRQVLQEERSLATRLVARRERDLPADVVEPEPEDMPACPRCDGPMLRRKARSGPHAGQLVWACGRYPDCRGTRRLES